MNENDSIWNERKHFGGGIRNKKIKLICFLENKWNKISLAHKEEHQIFFFCPHKTKNTTALYKISQVIFQPKQQNREI